MCMDYTSRFQTPASWHFVSLHLFSFANLSHFPQIRLWCLWVFFNRLLSHGWGIHVNRIQMSQLGRDITEKWNRRRVTGGQSFQCFRFSWRPEDAPPEVGLVAGVWTPTRAGIQSDSSSVSQDFCDGLMSSLGDSVALQGCLFLFTFYWDIEGCIMPRSPRPVSRLCGSPPTLTVSATCPPGGLAGNRLQTTSELTAVRRARRGQPFHILVRVWFGQEVAGCWVKHSRSPDPARGPALWSSAQWGWQSHAELTGSGTPCTPGGPSTVLGRSSCHPPMGVELVAQTGPQSRLVRPPRTACLLKIKLN